MVRTSPPRESPSGSMRGREGSLAGRAWVVYDHDTLRLAAAWSGQGFIDWNGINFNGRHQVHPRIVGKVHAHQRRPARAGQTPNNQSFADLRDPRARRPTSTVRCRGAGLISRGSIATGTKVILRIPSGRQRFSNFPASKLTLSTQIDPIFTRTLEIGLLPHRFSRCAFAAAATAVSLAHGPRRARSIRHGFTFAACASIRILTCAEGTDVERPFERPAVVREGHRPPQSPLTPLTHGGPKRWPEVLKTQAIRWP